jgi:hypothetical protein
MVVFSDGFESGDTSGWTSNTNSTDGSTTIAAGYKHTGSFGAYFAFTGGTEWTPQAFVAKTLPANYTTIYMRGYVQFKTLLPNSNNLEFKLMQIRSGSWPQNLATVLVCNDAGTVKWKLTGEGFADTLYSPGAAIALDNWYSIKLKVVVANGTGECHLYVDGSAVIDKTALDNDGIGEANEIYFGVPYSSMNKQDFGVWGDCVVVDTSDIAEEGGGSVYSPKTRSSLPATMMTMLNNKMLFSACNRFPKLNLRSKI